MLFSTKRSLDLYGNVSLLLNLLETLSDKETCVAEVYMEDLKRRNILALEKIHFIFLLISVKH